MATTQNGDEGDLRTEVLSLLAEEPRNGLELVGEITERSGGERHIPDATMYPLLTELSDEGLVRLSPAAGAGSRQRPYELTERGWLLLRGEVPPASDGPPPQGDDAEAHRIHVRSSTTPPWLSGDDGQPTTPFEEAAQTLWEAVERAHRDTPEPAADQACDVMNACARELRRLTPASGSAEG